ncbi:TetR family transcriptional regulator [Kitasatospora sp. NPDC059327]|uniref:TetR family transcriptional regulator n=1 Tax=Kitasatospora sp. NPDC059327 TaxID=3346803 RepID=UPI003697EBA1
MRAQETDTGAELGMRDRKKARTRESIRTAALDLFEEQGFERTTVDQICRRADVAHRTFFRYYATKEALLFGWDFGQTVLDAFAAAPGDLGLWEAFEHAVTATDGRMEEPAEHTTRRRALRRRALEIKSVRDFALVLVDTLGERAAGSAAERLGVDPDTDLRPAAFGAVLAGMIRRHLLSGSDTGGMAAWAAAYQDVLRPTR